MRQIQYYQIAHMVWDRSNQIRTIRLKSDEYSSEMRNKKGSSSKDVCPLHCCSHWIWYLQIDFQFSFIYFTSILSISISISHSLLHLRLYYCLQCLIDVHFFICSFSVYFSHYVCVCVFCFGCRCFLLIFISVDSFSVFLSINLQLNILYFTGNFSKNTWPNAMCNASNVISMRYELSAAGCVSQTHKLGDSTYSFSLYFWFFINSTFFLLSTMWSMWCALTNNIWLLYIEKCSNASTPPPLPWSIEESYR